MPDSINSQGEQKVPKKKSNMTIWVIAGIGAVGILVFFFVKKSNQNTQSSAPVNTSGSVDSGTLATLQAMGLLSGQNAGIAGPAGPAGPAINTKTRPTTDSPLTGCAVVSSIVHGQ